MEGYDDEVIGEPVFGSGWVSGGVCAMFWGKGGLIVLDV